MANRITIVACVLASLPILVGLGFGMRHIIVHGKSQQEQQQAQRRNRLEKARVDKIFESCKTQFRYVIRDHVKGTDITLGAAFWNGDEQRIVVVKGFARTVTSDVPVEAEFSRSAVGYTMARYKIGAKTLVADQVEYERITEIMKR